MLKSSNYLHVYDKGMDLGLGLNLETAAKLGIPTGSAVIGYLQRRKIKAQIEKIKASQKIKKDRKKMEEELTEARKKELRDMVLSVTGGVGNVNADIIDLNDSANKSSDATLLNRNIENDLDEEEIERSISLNGSICPRCTSPIQKDYRSCPNCSAKLKQECPGCHEILPMKFKSCPKCGTRFSKLWDPMAEVMDD